MAPSPPSPTRTKCVSTPRPQMLTHRSLSLLLVAVVLSLCFAASLATVIAHAAQVAAPVVPTAVPTLKSPIGAVPPITKPPTMSDPIKGTSEQPKPAPQSQCILNRTYSEMFCQFGPNSEANKAMDTQVKAILAKFDEQNDDRILGNFKEAQVDKNIALAISHAIKHFFNANFCAIVERVMSSMARTETEEVRNPIEKVTAINAFINRLEADLETAKATKHYEPRLVSLLEGLLKSVHDLAEKALTELHSLEKRLFSQTGPTRNELSYARTNILATLVAMFFDKAVMQKSTSIIESVGKLTADKCFEEKPTASSQSGDLQVACAFHFLFESGDKLRQNISDNFALEEAYAYQNGLDTPVSQSCGTTPRSSTDPAQVEKQKVAENACLLKDQIEHHEYPNVEALKTDIERDFPVKYHNKLETALSSGGPDGLVYALKSFCQNSAFVAFSMLDAGQIFQDKAQAWLTTPDSRDEELAAEPATTKISNKYIVESIIMYFLRAAEQRMSCSIKSF